MMGFLGWMSCGRGQWEEAVRIGRRGPCGCELGCFGEPGVEVSGVLG